MAISLFNTNLLVDPLKEETIQQEETTEEVVNTEDAEISQEDMVGGDVESPEEPEASEEDIVTFSDRPNDRPEPQNWYVHTSKTESGNLHSIYLFDVDYTPDYKHMSELLRVLANATENDVVSVYLNTRLDYRHGKTVLSAIEACKAHIKTHIDSCRGFLDLALWLSGDEISYSDATACRCSVVASGAFGTPVDMKIRAEQHRMFVSDLLQFIVDSGFMDEEEKVSVIDDKELFFSYGDDFKERVTRVLEARQVGEDAVIKPEPIDNNMTPEVKPEEEPEENAEEEEEEREEPEESSENK